MRVVGKALSSSAVNDRIKLQLHEQAYVETSHQLCDVCMFTQCLCF